MGQSTVIKYNLWTQIFKNKAIKMRQAIKLLYLVDRNLTHSTDGNEAIYFKYF